METPLELTQSVRDVSVTERAAFRSCRRRWRLETIENLEPRTPNWALAFGTGIHAGLEEYYKTKSGLVKEGDPLLNALDAFEAWHLEEESKIRHAGLGGMTDEVLNELWEYKKLGGQMLFNYNEFAKVEDKGLKVLAVEGQWVDKGIDPSPPYTADADPIRHESGRILVPIVDPESKRPIEPLTYLSMRLDLIMRDTRAGLKGVWPYDHKTTASSPSDRGLDFEDQVTGYDYGVWRLSGIIPRGTVFNYLVKNLPSEPRILQNGTLSTDKAQATLPEMYKAEMKKQGLMKGNRVTSEKHAECYEALLNKGWSPYFKRLPSQRNFEELMSFERRLIEEVADMKEAGELEHRAYPNPNTFQCPGCSVAPICQAMEDGSDVQYIVDTRFQQAEDRKAA